MFCRLPLWDTYCWQLRHALPCMSRSASCAGSVSLSLREELDLSQVGKPLLPILSTTKTGRTRETQTATCQPRWGQTDETSLYLERNSGGCVFLRGGRRAHVSRDEASRRRSRRVEA